MFNIGDFLNKDLIPQEKLARSERAQIIKEMYAIYTHPAERILRRLENWKRYCEFCRVIKKPNSTETQKLFKKGRTYIKEQPIKTFVFFLSKIPTKSLYGYKSEMMDCKNRGKSASAWLLGNTKKLSTGVSSKV